MKRLYLFISLLTVLISFLFRTVKLADRPPGFTWDEAAIGYNAYSLLLTGRDEYGTFLPFIFKSFGDYKPGLYIYSVVPTVKIFGLSEFSTRLPSAVFGTLLVISVALLGVRLFGQKLFLPVLVIMAVNPWAIHFSRGAWEANMALLLTVLGSLLFIRKNYFLSALFLGLTLFTYQGAKMFTPLALISLIFSFRPKISIRQAILPLILLGLFTLPILIGWTAQTGRLKVFSVFSYTRHPDIIARIQQIDSQSPWLFPLFHAEIIDQGRGIAQRYLNHFSPRFLFFEGDWSNLRQSIPLNGYFYLPELITLIMGIIILSRSRNPGALFLALWLFTAPLPSAFSRDIISGVRSLPLVVPLSIIIALGVQHLFTRKFLALAYFSISLFSILYFLDLYFVHTPFYTAADWLSAYRPAFEIIKKDYDRFDQIVFTSEFGQPYIFALFYLKYPPAVYQLQSRLTENTVGDVGQVESFAKFTFRPIFWPADRSLKSAMVVGGRFELPEQDLINIPNLRSVHFINYPDGDIALKIAQLE